MNGPVVPSDPKYFSQVCRQISRESRTTWNRLVSILYDAQFVQSVAQMIPFPVVSNLRCGVWYCQESFETCYFKSTDGHCGNWSFSLSRLNLHLLEIAALHQGLIIVDATRKGKLFPDALSKTIPIWITIMNQSFDLDSSLRLYQGVSASEHRSIELKVPEWKTAFLSLSFDLDVLKNKIKKPMRPFWVSQDSIESLSVLKEDGELAFYPVILLSCSANQHLSSPKGDGLVHDPFEYVPGAADDEESWSLGLTSQLFWKHHQELIASGPHRLQNTIRDLLETTIGTQAEKATCFLLKKTEILKISISSLSILDNVAWTDCSWFKDNLQALDLDCKSSSGRHLHVPIQPQKKDKSGLIKQLPTLLSFISAILQDNFSVAIIDQENRDISFCIVISAVIGLYEIKQDGSVEYTGASSQTVNKQTVQKTVAWLTAYLGCEYPSRGNLKQIFNFFYKGNLLGLKHNA